MKESGPARYFLCGFIRLGPRGQCAPPWCALSAHAYRSESLWPQTPHQPAGYGPLHLDQRRRPDHTDLGRYRHVGVHRHCTGRAPVYSTGHICSTIAGMDPNPRQVTTGCWRTLAVSPRYHKGRLPGSSAAPMAEIPQIYTFHSNRVLKIVFFVP